MNNRILIASNIVDPNTGVKDEHDIQAAKDEAEFKLKFIQLRSRMINNYKLGLGLSVELVGIIERKGFNNFTSIQQEQINKIPYCSSELFISTVLEHIEHHSFKKLSNQKKLDFIEYHLNGITRAANMLSHIRSVLVTTLDIVVVKAMSGVPALVRRTRLD